MVDTYYTQEAHGPFALHDIGSLELEEGGTIRNCQLAVATHGTLNAAKDNAILVPTWYSGTSKIMEQVYIGADRVLDEAALYQTVKAAIADCTLVLATTARAQRCASRASG